MQSGPYSSPRVYPQVCGIPGYILNIPDRKRLLPRVYPHGSDSSDDVEILLSGLQLRASTQDENTDIPVPGKDTGGER